MARAAATDTKDKEPTRPAVCEARRLRAAELFAQGRTTTEVAQAVGVTYEAARRWRVRWARGGPQALRRRRADGRPPKLSAAQVERVRQALGAGAVANGFDNDLWTVRRVARVVARTTGVRLSVASTWRLLTTRLGWSLQRPQRQAKERDEQAIARWVAYEWPRIKKGPRSNTPG
jgi:transposase